MRRPAVVLFVLLAALRLGAGPDAEPPAWRQLSVPPMKTSVYVASITLTPSVFVRQGDNYTATYDVGVWPWIFWGEHGTVTIRVPAADLARAARGETVTFSGTGANQKGRPRTVTGRAQPTDAQSGKLKLKIRADGFDLVFNGTYRLAPGP